MANQLSWFFQQNFVLLISCLYKTISECCLIKLSWSWSETLFWFICRLIYLIFFIRSRTAHIKQFRSFFWWPKKDISIIKLHSLLHTFFSVYRCLHFAVKNPTLNHRSDTIFLQFDSTTACAISTKFAQPQHLVFLPNCFFFSAQLFYFRCNVSLSVPCVSCVGIRLLHAHTSRPLRSRCNCTTWFSVDRRSRQRWTEVARRSAPFAGSRWRSDGILFQMRHKGAISVRSSSLRAKVFNTLLFPTSVPTLASRPCFDHCQNTR